MKVKNDKELEMKETHQKQKEELNQKEINLCLNRLDEINSKLNKTNQKVKESFDQKIA